MMPSHKEQSMVTTDYSQLTAEERAAVESIIPEPAEGQTKETVEQYLTRIGAGQSALDSYVQALRGAKQEQMAECVPALLDAGIDPQLIVTLATKFAQASAQVKQQVISLLTS
jgi:hypothetical protein